RRIHRQPEIGLDLPKTQAVIVEELGKLGLEGQPGSALSSVVAVIEGGRPGPTVLLRADMDALPLHEDTGLDFSSKVDGAMHACGHDTHVAMLLGAARLLQDRKADLPGKVILMFQPGEEGLGGAKTMIDEGLLEAAGPTAPTGALAVHIGTRYPTGEVHLRPGPQMAATDVIRITVRGRGGHASAPHLALDPIAVAELPAPIMGAEDFSYVLQKVPGAMAFVGARPDGQDPATAPQNHSNLVVFDEPAMAVGVALYAAVAIRHLSGGQ
ncbi:MAG TPA: M20 family metallopeptidase, partial [Candidatus Limnocylindrales bacterium]